MIVAIHSSAGVYFTEAESLAEVGEKIAQELPIQRFWYDSITGERWTEWCAFVENVQLIREEAKEPQP